MSEPLYLRDCYIKDWEAEIVKADKKYIVLNPTAFYPNKGGQPWDTGTITRKSDGKVFRIVYVGEFGGDISHEVDEEGLEVGDKVKCTIDWERRYLFMRYHTASHVLAGVIYKNTGALTTGSQIAEDKCRNDFSLESFDRELLNGFEEESNRIIQEGHSVIFRFMSRDEIEKRPELFRLAKGIDPQIKIFRIVDIEGFDAQACGGCHVKNTKEIKGIKITDFVNKGKNNRRIYFKLV